MAYLDNTDNLRRVLQIWDVVQSVVKEVPEQQVFMDKIQRGDLDAHVRRAYEIINENSVYETRTILRNGYILHRLLESDNLRSPATDDIMGVIVILAHSRLSNKRLSGKVILRAQRPIAQFIILLSMRDIFVKSNTYTKLMTEVENMFNGLPQESELYKVLNKSLDLSVLTDEELYTSIMGAIGYLFSRTTSFGH